MNKKVRQQVFDKFDGKCAYCGCELQKGWHVDHVEPIIRKKKQIPAGWFNKITGVEAVREDFKNGIGDEFEWRHSKWVPDGCEKPENNVIENMMPACQSCNINKHGDTIDEFRKSISGYLNSLNLRMVQYKMVKKYNLVQETGNPVVFYFETINPKP